MILKEFKPDPSLDNFVQCYRIIHFKFDHAHPLPCKVYPPKPENVLHFFLKEQLVIEDPNGKRHQQPLVLFVGQRTSVTKQIGGNGFLSLQIVFQPTAVFRLTGIPSAILTNQYINAENIFSNKIFHVHEQLQNAHTHDEMLLIANRFVTGLAKQVKKEAHLLDAVSAVMMQQCGNISLSRLANEACLCTKQFKRKFNERAGLNPKMYSRIIRFNKAINIKNAYPHMDWLRIAIESGYFDYQHLVKDYKGLTGLSPSEFHLHENKSPEKILGLADELYRSRVQAYMPIL